MLRSVPRGDAEDRVMVRQALLRMRGRKVKGAGNGIPVMAK